MAKEKPRQDPAVAVVTPNNPEPDVPRFGHTETFDDENVAVTRNRLSRFDSRSLLTSTDTAVSSAHPPTPPTADLRELAPEFFVSRLSHLSRRIEELHQAEANRFAEERRETWILVFALSVVLVFCFAAFFMTQMEVRDLRTGLEEALDRRATQTVSSIEGTLEDLHLDRIPKLSASLEKLITENDRLARGGLERLFADLRTREKKREKEESQSSERLVQVESQLECLLRITKEIRGEAVGDTKTSPANVVKD